MSVSASVSAVWKFSMSAVSKYFMSVSADRGGHACPRTRVSVSTDLCLMLLCNWKIYWKVRETRFIFLYTVKTILAMYNRKKSCSEINNQLYGHHSISYFDLWKKTVEIKSIPVHFCSPGHQKSGLIWIRKPWLFSVLEIQEIFKFFVYRNSVGLHFISRLQLFSIFFILKRKNSLILSYLGSLEGQIRGLWL